jgi:hypothetical protein
MTQDVLQQAKERYADAKEAMAEQHARMREDLAFSNPADPQQWDKDAFKARKDAGRPSLTFDRTNQFIMQVVNDGRQNKPSIQVLPADSEADPAVAEKLNGIIRHIEYVSRAGQAYDMALECAARVGLGWMRVIPQIMRPETNEQEIRILRVHDPLSINLDPGATEADGSDAMFGFAETNLTKRAFEAAYPKQKMGSWDADGWFSDKSVRIAEYFCVHEKRMNMIRAMQLQSGAEAAMPEEEFWAAHKEGAAIAVRDPEGKAVTYEAKERKVDWLKMSGLDILEQTTFPSQFSPSSRPGLRAVDRRQALPVWNDPPPDGRPALLQLRAASATARGYGQAAQGPVMVAFESVEELRGGLEAPEQRQPGLPAVQRVGRRGQAASRASEVAPPRSPLRSLACGQIVQRGHGSR